MYGHPLRIRSPWTQLAYFLGITGAAYVISALLMVAALRANGINPMQPDSIQWEDPRVLSLLKIMQAVSTVLMFFVPAYLYARFSFTGKYFHLLGFKAPIRLNMFVLSVMVILLAFPFVFWLGKLNQDIPLPAWMKGLENNASEQMEAFLKVKSGWDVPVNLFIIALLPAVCEEMFFRAALQRIMIHISRNPWLGIIISGFLFSAFHMQFEGFLPRMFLGIILGALYWYSGSIWTSITAHFVNNAVQVLVVSFIPKYANDNPPVPLYAAMVSGIAVWAILHFYRKQSTIRFSKVYETEELNPHDQWLAK